ncbi:Alpha/Beta hydrolase protein [Microdochium bolleyi]|uniref:Alpha/Beta hydrolase protein n=1 Tax=Microdochium bolleyi TaxID=196109 RepID=A0A136IZA0_9PEZI|nr:Alpha/Beta hydrolase protein [Microdochium bolleyi]
MGRLSNADNPLLIHDDRGSAGSSSIPLFLTHDGGGTTFAYSCLDPVGRETYGIHNANFDHGGFWTGGIREMAAHYVGLIDRTLPEGGDILLGGWSLGGILSLEMAHQIAVSGPARLRRFRVVGMLWMDTVFPHHVEGETMGTYVGPNERIPKSAAELAAMSNRELAGLNMMHARRMVHAWEMPRWGGKEEEEDGGGGGTLGRKPPPTILLRARDAGAGDDGKKFVDRTRQFRMLGWEKYDEENGGFICSVVDVEGEHFSMFDFDKIEGLSKQIRKAADELAARG